MPTISTAKDKRDDKEYSIQEIRMIKRESIARFENIKSNLVCYECSVPKMTPKLGSVNEHHYAKLPRQNHSFDCYYFGDEYTQKEVDSIVSTIKSSKPSQAQVANAFNQIQRYLDRDTVEPTTTTQENWDGRNTTNHVQPVGNDTQRPSNSKYIPRKKLTKDISDEDVGVWKIYYGQVGIKHHSENGEFDNFLVYSNPDCKMEDYRITLGINQLASKYFDDEQAAILTGIKESEQVINLMVLGRVSKKGRYRNLTVYDSRLLHLS